MRSFADLDIKGGRDQLSLELDGSVIRVVGGPTVIKTQLKLGGKFDIAP